MSRGRRTAPLDDSRHKAYNRKRLKARMRRQPYRSVLAEPQKYVKILPACRAMLSRAGPKLLINVGKLIHRFQGINHMFCASLIVLQNKDNNFLILRRATNIKTFPGLWGLPGGKAEGNETPEETGKRELLEETGVIVLKSLLTPLAITTSNEKDYYFFLAYTFGSEVMLDHEHTDFNWVSLEDLPIKCEMGIPEEAMERLRELSLTDLRFERGTQG